MNLSLTYHQYSHIIGVAGVSEPTEGADVVPAIQGRGEGSSAEGSSSGRATGPRGVVAVEVGGPTAQGLKGWDC